MPDSKISQLESANKIYDHDLMVVVTGYSTPGAYPDNCKITADRIRKDIVRLNEMIFFVSGFSGYYNTGENLFYITSHQRAGNLIKLDYPTEFPHSPQTISTTGLNAIMGNNIEIQFNPSTPAANQYGPIGSPNFSGIISVTGINATAGSGLYFARSNDWPYSNEIGILEKVYDKYSTSYQINSSYTMFNYVGTRVPYMDVEFLFPISIPAISSNLSRKNYTKIRCDGFYHQITLTSVLPQTTPSTTGPNGQPVSWQSFTPTNLIQGYAKPRLFGHQINNNNFNDYLPAYDYTKDILYTSHTTANTNVTTHTSVHIHGFFDIPNGYNYSGTMGFDSSEIEPARCTLVWQGQYWDPIQGWSSISGSVVVVSTMTITINGHRFMEIKPT